MRRAAAVLVGVVAALGSASGAGASGSVTLQVSTPWQAPSGSALWMPFAFTVSNTSGTTFQGMIQLEDPQTAQLNATYSVPVTVAAGATKRLQEYAPPPAYGPFYKADLVDAGGSVIDSSQVPIAAQSRWVGVLSDRLGIANSVGVAQVDVTSGGSVGSYPFTSAADLPPSAVYLKALTAIVIDEFDSATLTAAQVTVLRDYVDGGGSLVIATGAEWRRTLQGLPADLVPLTPDRTQPASLQPLQSLVGGSTADSATVAPGSLRQGARIAIGDAAAPLLVEMPVGAGRVVELTFDPGASGISYDTGVQVWGQAVQRAGLPGSISSNPFCCKGMFPPNGGASAIAGRPVFGGVMTSWSNYSQGIQQVLLASGQAVLPPAWLLLVLLLVYLGLAGPLNYLVLRRVGRRELAWLTVPLLAMVAGGSAYGFGIGRAGSVFDNQLAIAFQLADGKAEVTAFHGVFVPHRGDYRLRLRTDELAAGLGGFGSGTPNSESLAVRSGSEPDVLIGNAAVWSETPLRTEEIDHTAASVQADLSYSGSTVTGTLRNTGSVALRSIGVWLPDHREVSLAGDLAPGASRQVFGSPANLANGSGGYFGAYMTPYVNTGPGQMTEDQKLTYVEQLAASLDGNPSGPVVVAGYDAPAGIQLDTGRSGGTTTAVLVAAAAWRAVDTPPAMWLPGREVASGGGTSAGNRVNVYEFDLPAGIHSTLLVRMGGSPTPGGFSTSCNSNGCVSFATPGPPTPITSGAGVTVEYLDPGTGSWQTLPDGQALPAPVTDGASLLIRVTGPANNVMAVPQVSASSA